MQYKNKAVNTGTVTIFDDQNRPYQGPIQNGQYSVSGIPAGPVQLIVVSQNPVVAVAAPPPRPGEKGGRPAKPPQDGQAPADASGWFAIPKKYEDMKTSNLKTEVKSGPNTYNLDLKD